MSHAVSIIVIGRNEGYRLRRCLGSVAGCSGLVVYVDSGSTDDSVTVARQMGAIVVDLDRSAPFSAARARNAGIQRLIELTGEVDFVQFVDGDCEISDGWLEWAVRELENYPEAAVVCGRLRERNRDASIYNRLCDLEWDGPVGEVAACGGIAMYRASAFREAGGFNPAVTAGEEPELCVRLRQRGWKIRRIDAEMALHDAAMTRFGQWWKRSVRAGHAYAEGAALHGRSPQRHWLRESRSIWFWGLILPVLAGLLAWPTWGGSLFLLVGYPALGVRVHRHMHGRGFGASDSQLYAFFCVLAKFPQAWGQIRYLRDRVFGRPGRLIEYKEPARVAN